MTKTEDGSGYRRDKVELTEDDLREAAERRILEDRVGKAFVPDKPITNKVTGGSTPNQYALPEGAKEIQDLIEYREMNFSVGNIFKAVYRLGKKEGVTKEYDLNKIIFFAKRELDRLKC